jgi:hypothetical protein
MIKKAKISFVSLIYFLCTMGISNANAQVTNIRTSWKIVDKSMAELLNSGWKVVHYSSDRVVILPGTVSGSDQRSFTYLLYKNGKYINCFLVDPRPDNAYSGCREIN